MKISVNTIKWNGYDDIVSLPIEELVKKIGAQIGEIEEVTQLAPKYKGIVVAKVISCEQHPNADKLHVCKIDDGKATENVERDKNGYVQVVCGAPNVREGLTVAWLPPGATVPSSADKDPFVLGARELRGVVSNGMLASASELAISDDHSGLLEIKPEEVGEELTKPGTPIVQLYGLDDIIVDIENKMFTHRPDCFGILGVAREIAGIQDKAFHSPEWYLRSQLPQGGESQLALEVHNEVPDLVKRFMAVPISGVIVGSSPVWLQSYLSRLGIKAINNVVDITNYLMILTGQPLHAYDYDKVQARSNGTTKLIIRQATGSDTLALLNGKSVTFEAPTVLIATDKEAIGVGGVMGGADTEVDENTKSIILEVATFDMYNIRRTSMKYGLFTDAVTRFNKGQSPLQNDKVLAKAVEMIAELASGGIAGSVVDNIPAALQSWSPVAVNVAFITERLGVELTQDEVCRLLTNVEFGVETSEGNQLRITPPFWRTDIAIPEDIVEEVGRLYGYDRLPKILPKRDLTPAVKNAQLELQDRIRSTLSSAGANEVLTYSFVHSKLFEKVGQDTKQAFQLSNALSPDLQYYRLSLTPSLLDKVHANIKAGFEEFALYEINIVHIKGVLGQENVPNEHKRVALVFAADEKTANYKYSGAPYYQALSYLSSLLADFGLDKKSRFVPLNPENYMDSTSQKITMYDPGRSATIIVDDVVLGEIGEYKSSVRKALKLPAFSAGFELDLGVLAQKGSSPTYTVLSKFPKTQQDISFKLPISVAYDHVLTVIQQSLEAAQQTHGYDSSISPVDIYQAADADTKNTTFRITLSHPERTLVTEEVNTLLSMIAQNAKDTLGAIRL